MLSTETPDRKPYHHGALKESAIEEGTRLLQENGVSKFSLREVARRLGVTPTALYHHFPDKEDLLAELARGGLGQFQEMLAAALQGAKPGDGLAAMGLAYIRFFAERPYYMDLLFRPATKQDESVRDIWTNTFQLVETNLLALGMSETEAPLFGIWLWSGVHGLAGMLRDRILGNPEACGPDAPGVFLMTGDELVQSVVPLVGRLIGTIPTLPR